MRWLVSPSPYGQGHRLGIIWLQEPGGHHRIDGDHLAYLHSTHDADEDLRSLDPDLYDRLRLMAAQLGRPVSVRETCRALPSDTVRFDRPLRFDGLAPGDRAARAVVRQRWFHEARVAVSPCSLVFLDSDDGVAGDAEPRTSSDPTDCGVLMSEVGQLLERRHSVVLHQLVDPTVALADLALARMRDIHEALGIEPLVLSEESHGRARLFTMIPHERHQSDLHDRIGAMQLSRWGDDIRVHRWRAAYVTA